MDMASVRNQNMTDRLTMNFAWMLALSIFLVTAVVASFMPPPKTRFEVTLPETMASQVHDWVASGQYANSNDVFRDALRALAREQAARTCPARRAD